MSMEEYKSLKSEAEVLIKKARFTKCSIEKNKTLDMAAFIISKLKEKKEKEFEEIFTSIKNPPKH